MLSGAIVDILAAIDLQCARLERVDPEAYTRAVARRPEGSTARCHIFAAPRSFIDGGMYPDPATMALVDETDAQEGMRHEGQIFAALAPQGLMQYRFQ